MENSLNILQIQNPILTGFNPDPSICVVGEDFYIATSTFEWFPGVQIHHSKDLKNWRLLSRPLNRVSQLDLKGCQASGGIWAPCLSYDGDLFHLICANVKNYGGPITDSQISLYTAKEIDGEWSEPIPLGSNGFDPSIFHDNNGKKYLVNMEMGGFTGANRFNGITLQEYCPQEKTLIGKRKQIWEGTNAGCTEGPHIYQKDGYYYLITAEGGTSFKHCVSMARSKDLWGPYEVAPSNPMLSSKDQPGLYLQAAGHGDLFQTPNGDWYIVHLCRRYFENNLSVSVLGRETAIQKVIWEEHQFPRLASGKTIPENEILVEDLNEHPWDEEEHIGFQNGSLNKHLQFLREPADKSWLSFERTENCLSLKGRSHLYSNFNQSLVARRLQHHRAKVETCISFNPQFRKQEAGIVAFYDGSNHISFAIHSDSESSRYLGITVSNNSSGSRDNLPVHKKVGEIPQDDSPIHLRMEMDNEALRFHWSLDQENWEIIDEVYNSTNMGDGASNISQFTGTFWGIYCHDSTGDGLWADFKYFNYTPL